MTKKSGQTKTNQWMEVMMSGQFTRDRGLRTRSEIEKDRALAESLDKRRRELFPDFYRKKDGNRG